MDRAKNATEYRRDLPGRPDLVLPKYRAAVFVHGCFWHVHHCTLFQWPRTRRDFWMSKLTGNQERDKRARDALHALGWRVLVVWECALRGPTQLAADDLGARLASWLKNGGSTDLHVPRSPSQRLPPTSRW